MYTHMHIVFRQIRTCSNIVIKFHGTAFYFAESMELMDFDSDVIVISNRKCPSWAVERALQLGIPVLSTTWVTQCLIESKRCPYDQHPRYKYNYTD